MSLDISHTANQTTSWLVLTCEPHHPVFFKRLVWGSFFLIITLNIIYWNLSLNIIYRYWILLRAVIMQCPNRDYRILPPKSSGGSRLNNYCAFSAREFLRSESVVFSSNIQNIVSFIYQMVVGLFSFKWAPIIHKHCYLLQIKAPKSYWYIWNIIPIGNLMS